MSPERNDPCPCGSGKKYKKCCGLAEAANKVKPDLLALNQAVAYLGEVGRQREAFCVDYTTFKKAMLAGLEAGLQQDVAAKGETISCGKGCAHCCEVYVFTTLQEGETIVHYLYQHEEAHTHFIAAYRTWRERVRRFERIYRRIEHIQEKVIFGRDTPEERQLFNHDLTFYADQGLPCPFLHNSACTIYEVRPYVCAGVVSSSPREWCHPGHPCHQQTALYKVDVKIENDMPYFIRPQSSITFGSLPELVYNLMEKGYALLSTVQGLEGIREEVNQDPEVRIALKRFGL
jgi:Fe-S-cluster containining protein